MEDALLALLRWLHLTATVLWIGLAVSSVLVFIPLTRQHIPKSAMADYVADLRKRAAAVVWTAIAIFAASGFVLMLTAASFGGFSNYFANSWSILITIKHAVIGGMVVLVLYQFNSVMPRLETALRAGAPEANALAGRQKSVAAWIAGLGILVLLLTAIAEVSAV
jgi:uncharacterized membrane protein